MLNDIAIREARQRDETSRKYKISNKWRATGEVIDNKFSLSHLSRRLVYFEKKKKKKKGIVYKVGRTFGIVLRSRMLERDF